MKIPYQISVERIASSIDCHAEPTYSFVIKELTVGIEEHVTESAVTSAALREKREGGGYTAIGSNLFSNYEI